MTNEIAIAVGVYALAAGLGLALKPSKVDGLFTGLRDDTALAYVTGIVVFTIGAVIIMVHNTWGTWLEIVVSVIGWGSALEGIAFLVGPGAFMAIASRAWTPGLARLWAIVAIAFGAVLVAAGLTSGTFSMA